MPKYLVKAKYTQEGLKGLVKEGGTGRRAALEQVYASVGGKLESMYWALGDEDVYIIADVPDHVALSALGIAVGLSGAATTSATVLLTAEEVDAATKKNANYRAPGK